MAKDMDTHILSSVQRTIKDGKGTSVRIHGNQQLCRLLDQTGKHNFLTAVYELVPTGAEEVSSHSHLWAYHSRVTLEHLFQTLQTKRMKQKFPILYDFIKQVTLIYHCKL